MNPNLRPKVLRDLHLPLRPIRFRNRRRALDAHAQRQRVLMLSR
jgi:hypothetical protein